MKNCHLKPFFFLSKALSQLQTAQTQKQRDGGKDLQSITRPSPCSTAGSALPKSQIKKQQKKITKVLKAELNQLSNQLKVWLLGLTGFGRSEARPRYSFQPSSVLMSKEQVICSKVWREIRGLAENSWKWGDWERVIYKRRLSGFSYKKTGWNTSAGYLSHQRLQHYYKMELWFQSRVVRLQGLPKTLYGSHKTLLVNQKFPLLSQKNK